ncbi:hypothetical protein FACS189473_5730 [Spirochaetia bacterium]|nr:hypothetical protein FACS189473_5730 [Spirochaetia bacterium]
MKKINEITLGYAVKDRAEKTGSLEAYVFPNRSLRLTFGDLGQRTGEFAKGLIAAGLKKGDNIGILANNVPEWILTFYAASRLGIVVVPVNPQCTVAELGYILNNADIKALFCY